MLTLGGGIVFTPIATALTGVALRGLLVSAHTSARRTVSKIPNPKTGYSRPTVT
ncbi:MAG TPA: hypothetical protein VIM33_02225 [Gaiellaceae bacterium]